MDAFVDRRDAGGELEELAWSGFRICVGAALDVFHQRTFPAACAA
jgi:hypothetical protein